MTWTDLMEKVVRFRDERDWGQFHSPRNLAAALAIEAAELQESMLWKTDEEVEEILQSSDRSAITEELADVLIYALLLAHRLDEDLEQAVLSKLEVNARKYPVELAKGRSLKYTRLESGQE